MQRNTNTYTSVECTIEIVDEVKLERKIKIRFAGFIYSIGTNERTTFLQFFLLNIVVDNKNTV